MQRRLVSSCTDPHLKVATALIICKITQVKRDGGQELSCSNASSTPGELQQIQSQKSWCIINGRGIAQLPHGDRHMADSVLHSFHTNVSYLLSLYKPVLMHGYRGCSLVITTSGDSCIHSCKTIKLEMATLALHNDNQPLVKFLRASRKRPLPGACLITMFNCRMITTA